MEDDYIEHTVSPTDTLAGVALKYGVTIPALKQANGIRDRSPSLFATVPVLKVPRSTKVRPVNLEKSPVKDKNQIVKEFVSLEKCTAFEAKTYLEECDYDLETARENRKAKLSGERPTPVVSASPFDSPTTSSRIGSSKVKTLGVKTRTKMEQLSNDIYDL